MSIEVPSKKGAINFATDEEYKNIIWDKVPTLKPAFKKDGTITAVNASKINDGAAALVLMSKQKAEELGIKPIARIAGYADAAQEPEWFTTTPAKAIPRAVSKAGWTLADVDKFEINEAFSVVALANIKEMNLDHEKVNVLGGAVALGHPVGVSGARIICTPTIYDQLLLQKCRCRRNAVCTRRQRRVAHTIRANKVRVRRLFGNTARQHLPNTIRYAR